MKKIAIILMMILGLTFLAKASTGYFEFGVHYSTWNIDMADDFVNDNITPKFKYYDPNKGNFDFNSDGNNYGLELRFFPGGKTGSFSIGLSYEKNNFKGTLDGTYTETDSKGNTVKAEGHGKMDLTPDSFNANLRWEIAPTGRIHPYIGIGFGFGKMSGVLNVHTKQTITTPQGYVSVEEADETKTLKQALDELEEEEGEKFPLKFFPIVQLQLGLRAEILPNVYILVEGAVYDGLSIRGGLAVRL